MIKPLSYLNVADNTGARQLMCIRVLGGGKQTAGIGDVIIAVVKDALPNMPLKKSNFKTIPLSRRTPLLVRTITARTTSDFFSGMFGKASLTTAIITSPIPAVCFPPPNP